MPRLSFEINSVSKSEYESLMQSYQGISVAPVPPPSLFLRIKNILGRIILFLSPPPRKRRGMRSREAQVRHSAHPILDAEFLAFCITVAEHMREGYLVGPGHRGGLLYPYDRVTLSGNVRGESEIVDGWDKLVSMIRPHSYTADVPDIPVYGELQSLMKMTHDRSIARLLSRLALWLLYFVYSSHYCHTIVAYHPKTKKQTVFDNRFFIDIASRMSL